MTERTFGDEKSFELSKKKFLLDFMELSFSNSNLASFLIGKSSQASLPNIPLVPSSTNKNSGANTIFYGGTLVIGEKQGT